MGTPSSAAREGEHLLGQFIPLHYHYQMLLDDARMRGFKTAIERAVHPQDRVVELGGGTGVMSFFAAKKAKKVWCVEQNPSMAQASRRYLSANGVSNIVEVVEADAAQFVPPEPVQVVICEMLHSALLREKQVQVIQSFKKNYQEKFPGKSLPLFIPEATFLGVQPVQQSFDFYGYNAPLPVFYPPELQQTNTTQLSDPLIYSAFEYRGESLSVEQRYSGSVKIAHAGEVNALRFITKNVLAVVVESNSTVDWHNFYMILPLPQPISTQIGDRIGIDFHYPAGGTIESLLSTMVVKKL